jgi:hypothetical protein
VAAKVDSIEATSRLLEVMVKTYDRWGPTQAFGLICSAGSCSVYDGKLAFVPALEDVLVWDVKKGQMVRNAFCLYCYEHSKGNYSWLCGMKLGIEQKLPVLCNHPCQMFLPSAMRMAQLGYGVLPVGHQSWF